MKRIWKSIGLAVLLAALLVGTGAAGYTTDVGGDVISAYTVSVLDTDIEFGDFSIIGGDGTTAGDNYVASTDFISVATNRNIKLQAAEIDSGTGDGCMEVDSNTLNTALKMSVGGVALASIPINDAYVDVSGTITATTDDDLDADFVQTILASDTVDDEYTMTVTIGVVTL